MLSAWLLSAGFPQFADAATHEIGMKDQRFSINRLTIKVGDTVKWINRDSESRQVMSGKDLEYPEADSPMSGDLILIGGEFSFKFDKPGRYLYGCTLFIGGRRRSMERFRCRAKLSWSRSGAEGACPRPII